METKLNAGWILEADDNTDYAPPTLANGMIGLVPSKQGLRLEQIILNGVYDNYGPDKVSRILPGLQFADLDLRLDGLSIGSSQALQEWRQSLDMKEASLTTTFTFAQKIQVEQSIYALRHMPFSALESLTLTALADVTITVQHRLVVPDIFQPREQQFRYYQEVPGSPIFSSTALSPTGRHELCAAITYLFQGGLPHLSHATVSERVHEVCFRVTLARGASFHFGLAGSICTTAHFADPSHEAERFSIFANFEGEERLVARHTQAWARLWESDIIIESDLEAQQAVRFALYNLYSFVRAGSRYSLPPMGLSSIGYNGHIFWDSELWMYPPLLLLQPELARALLDYRYDRLAAAQRKAAGYGFQGAMYPWESDDTGEECTPTWALTGAFEHHITACVGLAFWDYYWVTGDKTWLQTQGYPVLKQVAQFWLSRVEQNEARQYEIRHVVGADEYTGVVNNDAFTNGAALAVLKYATLAAQELGLEPDASWRAVAEHMLILTLADGTTQEYEGYDGRIIKQADANLLAYPLKVITDEKIIRQDLAYYEARLDEDAPAMSHSVLAVISARLGDSERAYELFKRSYQPNQKPPFGVLSETPYSNNPYFATAAGGMLQAVLFGFGGLALTEQGIERRRPCLPPGWKSLTIKGVGINKETVTIP
jgi:trehalose/maltose hydrolase-like predicted phosphorylase